MAVRTPHDALSDFLSGRRPVSDPDHPSDLHNFGFRIEMIKVKRGDIGCAAVDTRMAEQVSA
jgi:hypothetical protein